MRCLHNYAERTGNDQSGKEDQAGFLRNNVVKVELVQKFKSVFLRITLIGQVGVLHRFFLKKSLRFDPRRTEDGVPAEHSRQSGDS